MGMSHARRATIGTGVGGFQPTRDRSLSRTAETKRKIVSAFFYSLSSLQNVQRCHAQASRAVSRTPATDENGGDCLAGQLARRVQ